MSDFPRAPRLPSIPRHNQESDTEPPDDSIAGCIREVRGALRNACEKMVALETRLLQHEISILTVEHQIHTEHDKRDAHAAEFGRLVARVTALELAATAAE